MSKKIILLTLAGAVVVSTAAHAGVRTRDAYTDGGATADVCAVAAKSSQSYVYADGSRVTDRRDVFTDGARITSRDGLVEDGT